MSASGAGLFPEDALGLDHLLAGRLKLWQPRAGYRAATDPVLLAAAVMARPGESVLELGCGAGAALLSLGLRVPDLALFGAERQPGYAALARRNAGENGLGASIIEADIAALPPELRRSFDHVITNPPWFATTSPGAADQGRDIAQRETVPVADWLAPALARLRPGGWLTLVHLAERVPEILAALAGRTGSVALRPLAAREGRAAGRVLLQARKGARGPFRLLAPLVIHEGAAHPGDRDHYTAAADAILRGGEALGWN